MKIVWEESDIVAGRRVVDIVAEGIAPTTAVLAYDSAGRRGRDGGLTRWYLVGVESGRMIAARLSPVEMCDVLNRGWVPRELADDGMNLSPLGHGEEVVVLSPVGDGANGEAVSTMPTGHDEQPGVPEA